MLHWPDSMFSYIAEDELLLSNDAFGQHLASTFLFNDEVDEHILMDEAAKYYANILYPFSPLVVQKINDIVKLDLKIKMIAPAHGLVWRKDPNKIIEAYLKWAKGEAKDAAVIVYDTMWESTEKMAMAVLEGLQSEGVGGKLFKVSITDRNDIIKELLEAKAVIAASSTINNDMLPVMAPFLDDLIGLKPKNKVGAAFGSYGWAGGAVRTIEEKLQKAGIKLIKEGLQVKWSPTEEELKNCFLYGKSLGQQIKAHKN
jgi:anaerobic nitric oxide reductase flavorubredoxin